MWNEEGFLLIESILVLILLGVVVFLMSPHFSSTMKTSSLNEEAKKIRSCIREAQEKAMCESRPYRIFFNTSSETYNVTYYNVTTWMDVETITLKNNIGIDSTTFTNNIVEFNKTASFSGGGNVVLNEGSNTKTVNLTVKTGKITFQ